jgi:ribose 5-phosphate isomerase B
LPPLLDFRDFLRGTLREICGTLWEISSIAGMTSRLRIVGYFLLIVLPMSDQHSIRIAIGGDHAGFSLKQKILGAFSDRVDEIFDCGTNSEERCDYPDFAIAVAKRILRGQADRGIVVCGSGVGVSVAANKIPGIRAAICHDTYSAHQGVEHDDMNVLCIGGRIIGSELAFEIVESFLNARYVPETRHANRLEKVLQIERLGIKAVE